MDYNVENVGVAVKLNVFI